LITAVRIEKTSHNANVILNENIKKRCRVCEASDR